MTTREDFFALAKLLCVRIDAGSQRHTRLFEEVGELKGDYAISGTSEGNGTLAKPGGSSRQIALLKPKGSGIARVTPLLMNVASGCVSIPPTDLQAS